MKLLGEASIKRNGIFQKNSEILRPPRPLPAVWRPQFFSDKEISELARPPPPFGKKFQNIFIFFLNLYGLGETLPFGKNFRNILRQNIPKLEF